MLHAEALRRYCAQMTEQYGLAIDTAFVDQYQDPKLWFLELISETSVRTQLQDIARSAQQQAAAVGAEGLPDYDLGMFDALKHHFLNVMQGDREPETLEEFIVRGFAFKREVQEYGR